MRPRRSIPARTRGRSTLALRPAPPDDGKAHPDRFIARETADRVIAVGLQRAWVGDLYHQLLRLSWPGFLAGLVGCYLATNIVFAVLYLLQPGAIDKSAPGNPFWDAFFFSVQTIATIGYGAMSPATFYANIVVTIETAVGLLFLALATGLVFARFSRPTARVLFSEVAVVAPHNGIPTLSLRLANQRRNQILQAQVDVALLLDEQTAEGDTIRRFYDLNLARRRSPVFALTFSVMHAIDADSPLYGATPISLEAQHAELVVTVTGLDETTGQPVHARTSYLPAEILWGRRFVDVIGWTEEGRRAIDYRRFHDTVPARSAH